MLFKKILFSLIFAVSFFEIYSQEQPKAEKKIQEVVLMQEDALSPQPNADGSIPLDTLPPKGMSISEISKRSVIFFNFISNNYSKTNISTIGNKSECLVTFNYKPKELNPTVDVQGTITMYVSIDAKEGKYRYTVSKITHNARNLQYSGGEVYNEIPNCGSFVLPTDLWKRIKGEAYKQSALLINDLKEAMKIPSSKSNKGDNW